MGVVIADTCQFLLCIQFTFASCTSLIMYKFKVVSLEREDCGCRNCQNLIGIRGGVGEEAEEKLDSEVEKQTLASIAKEEDTLGRRIGGESRILLGCSALVAGSCASSVSDYSCRESEPWLSTKSYSLQHMGSLFSLLSGEFQDWNSGCQAWQQEPTY